MVKSIYVLVDLSCCKFILHRQRTSVEPHLGPLYNSIRDGFRCIVIVSFETNNNLASKYFFNQICHAVIYEQNRIHEKKGRKIQCFQTVYDALEKHAAVSNLWCYEIVPIDGFELKLFQMIILESGSTMEIVYSSSSSPLETQKGVENVGPKGYVGHCPMG